MSDKPRKVHSYIPELSEQLRKGEIDRREFLRTATLLGVSASAAYAMAGKLTGDYAVPQAPRRRQERRQDQDFHAIAGND